MRILGIEKSCDETAAALVTESGEVLADVVASQIETHGPYGGIVPELASRAHMRAIVLVVRQAIASLPEALEVVDAVNGSFTYDDVETITLLAEIAGAALAEGDELAAPPSPARLGEALASLSTTDPGRYREVARAVEALL